MYTRPAAEKMSSWKNAVCIGDINYRYSSNKYASHYVQHYSIIILCGYQYISDIECHVHMYEYFGGVPSRTVSDKGLSL